MQELGEEMRVFRNDKVSIDTIRDLRPTGIIISPGPKDPTKAGISEIIIKEFAPTIPILGVCLGHQTLAHAFGAQIIKGKQPMHGKISKISHDGQGVFEGIKTSMKVTRYHSLVVDENSLPIELVISARASDGTIMGLRHRNYPLEGVQFHPEAVLTECGHELLNNFIKMAKARLSNENI